MEKILTWLEKKENSKKYKKFLPLILTALFCPHFPTNITERVGKIAGLNLGDSPLLQRIDEGGFQMEKKN
jgi:hypothetical protein